MLNLSASRAAANLELLQWHTGCELTRTIDGGDRRPASPKTVSPTRHSTGTVQPEQASKYDS